MKKTINRFVDILIPVIILIILIFVILGINYHKLFLETVSTRNKINKHKKRDIELKRKSKKLSNIYLMVRFLIVIILAALTLTLFYFDFINNIDDLVNLFELLFLFMATISFLKYGKFSALKKQLNKAEEGIRLWVYGEYANIDEEIINNSLELEELKKTNK